jgi:rhodanese-related sulfurtransferase
MNNISELIGSGATIIDVRTSAEYVDGHLKGSINIPLSEITSRLDEFKNPKGVIVCCASGMRSYKVAIFLKQAGIHCLDGGSWLNLKSLFI